MENKDLIRKKSIALDTQTYERLSKFAAQLRLNSEGGAFVSMGAAVAVLLGGYYEPTTIKAADNETECSEPEKETE